MRCPKCGYISFDHLEKCLKCNKDVQEVSNRLFGSTYNVQPPVFLSLNGESNEDSSETDFFEGVSFDGGEEVVDEELGVLVQDDQTGEEGEVELVSEEQVDEVMSEDESGEIEIDFSQFQDMGKPAVNQFSEEEDDEDDVPELMADSSLSMELPEELADMSDLARQKTEDEAKDQPVATLEHSDSADEDLDELNFDLALDGFDETPAKKVEMPRETMLALDEIDFSEALGESDSKSSKKSSSMDMDEDMDFDLDLGGLSIHNELR